MDVLNLLYYYSKLPSDINAPQQEATHPFSRNCPYTEWLPLQVACVHGQVQAVEFLFQTYEDIDINAKTLWDSTEPLLEVCMGDRNGAGVDLLNLLLHYSDQRNLGINVNVKDYGGNNAVYTAYPDYEKMEILIARGVSVLERGRRGELCFFNDWKACSQRFFQILNVTENLTTLQMLNLFTEKLEILTDAIPKVGRRYVQRDPATTEDMIYTARADFQLDAEDQDRRARSKQRAFLLILKTLRDQNIDLRTVEHFFTTVM